MIAAVVIAVAVWILMAKPKSATIDGTLAADIRYHAERAGLNPAQVFGVVMRESSGVASATNPSDPSAGLMGVMPLIGRAYGGLTGSDEAVLAALLQPDVNLKAGTGFMKHLQGRYASRYPFQTWIQAYNLGETKFDKGIRSEAYGRAVVEFTLQWKG